MNRPIRRVAVAAILMIAALLVNVTWVQAIGAGGLNRNPGNQRVLLAEYSRERGSILVNGRAVARSVPTHDRLKFLRRYPGGAIYAPLTGFYSLVYGSSGIEDAYNSQLAGTDDALFVRRVVDLVTGADQQGASVELTVDARAQQAAWDGLAGHEGAVAAIEPDTGRVLALASSPSYNPALLSSHDTAAIRSAWTALDPASPASPLLDRATRQLYPPGSVFKLVTAAAALESGRYSPDSTLPGPARLPLPGTGSVLPNEDGASCGPGDRVTLLRALEVSCNTAFASLGLRLGAATLRSTAQAFGFDTPLLPDLHAVASRFPAAADPGQTALSAIGQFDVRATVLQMAVVAATIADGGQRRDPYVVDRVIGPNLQDVSRSRPSDPRRVLSQRAATELTTMMEGVVREGTGTSAAIDGVRVAGKTGTAQVGGQVKPVAWFVAFAPADHPRVAVAVAVPNADVPRSEIAGGRLAAPIARAVIEAVLRR